MPDYQEMYFKLFRATERAINVLIAAQQECEELYLADGETAEPSTENPPRAPFDTRPQAGVRERNRAQRGS